MTQSASSTMTVRDIENLSYVDFMALLEERNRAPGGKGSISRIIQNSYLTQDSQVLHIGCNTGITTRQIAGYVKCYVTGIDIAESMVQTAIKITKQEKLSKYAGFQVGDASDLPFGNSQFDLIVSPGSIAFMSDKKKVMNESVRVLKLYGFFADVPMFYLKQPPRELLDRLNKLMHIDIQSWGLDYWKSLYEHSNLEPVYEFTGGFRLPSAEEIKQYCDTMCQSLDFPEATKQAAGKRLYKIMSLFAENHRYLGYAVLIYQKVVTKEQVSLFGK